MQSTGEQLWRIWLSNFRFGNLQGESTAPPYFMSIVTSPFPPYQNEVINSDYYTPNFFLISAITLGKTTAVTTSVDHNFSVGQLVRFRIPARYKTRELDNVEGTVVSVPTSTQLVCEIESSGFTPFVASPYVATITNITQAANPTITASNSFLIGDLVEFSGVTGMTEINGEIYKVLSGNSSSFVVQADTSSFSAYSADGTATFVPTYPSAYVLAIGDLNSGAINSDNSSQQLYINGSFRNVSPQ